MNYLASPPLVRGLCAGRNGRHRPDQPSRSAPAATASRSTCATSGRATRRSATPSRARSARSMFKPQLRQRVRRRQRAGTRMASPDGALYQWDEASTYIKNPPYFEGMTMDVGSIEDIHGARALGVFGDSITTDHISPAGNIKASSPAGAFLQGRGVTKVDFNSYGCAARQRRRDGARHLRQHPHQEPDAGRRGRRQHDPLSQRRQAGDLRRGAALQGRQGPAGGLAGKEYGTGSSRDWAAKGTMLLGVKAVIAESFRAHPSLQPGRHGRAAAAVHGRRERADPRPQGR